MLRALICPVLSDPDHSAYRAQGLGQRVSERVLYEAPDFFVDHERAVGVEFQAQRGSADARSSTTRGGRRASAW
jgi:hypothetical protein